MSMRIAGAGVAVASVVPGLAYDYSATPYPFELTVAMPRVLGVFADYYDEYRADCLRFPDPECATERALADAGWPGFAALARAHRDTFGAFLRHARADLLNALFLDVSDRTADWFLTEATAIRATDADVVISGAACRRSDVYSL